jgi:hypothetical protein
MDFTIEGYRSLIVRFRDLGYVMRDYSDVVANERHLILRHDIDFCLASAVDLARVESGLGVRSIYFIQTRSEFYNPLTPTAGVQLRALRNMGHAIGLHFDPRSLAESELEAAIVRDGEHLAGASDGPVLAVSFHRPPAEHIGGREKIGGLWNAYAARFVGEIGYCSDSRGAWHHGKPLDHLSVENGVALQLLTHPIWWSGPYLPPQERLQRFLADFVSRTDREMAANCRSYGSTRYSLIPDR